MTFTGPIIRDATGPITRQVLTSSFELNVNITSNQILSSGASGEEFLISTNNLGEQEGNTVLALSDGGFWTAWHSFDPATGDADSASIALQRFDASGDRVGGEILVNSGGGGQFNPSMAQLDGNVVVVWESNDPSIGEVGGGIAGKIFALDGTEVVSEFEVNVEHGNRSLSSASSPDVSALQTGGFVVGWQVSGPIVPGEGQGISVQAFDDLGQPRGAEIVSAQDTGFGGTNPSVQSISSPDNESFVVVWAEDGGVFAQAYAADGTIHGDLITVTSDGAAAGNIGVTARNSGFSVTWVDEALGVLVQRYTGQADEMIPAPTAGSQRPGLVVVGGDDPRDPNITEDSEVIFVAWSDQASNDVQGRLMMQMAMLLAR